MNTGEKSSFDECFNLFDFERLKISTDIGALRNLREIMSTKWKREIDKILPFYHLKDGFCGHYRQLLANMYEEYCAFRFDPKNQVCGKPPEYQKVALALDSLFEQPLPFAFYIKHIFPIFDQMYQKKK